MSAGPCSDQGHVASAAPDIEQALSGQQSGRAHHGLRGREERQRSPFVL